ncbi:hypothetical protein VNO77_44043 [Canavalia gladiata]|uniref:Uncharacterized protein n=1 Tax=Canavalia gladiata TaxID=3824 RepID=A0AAN9PQE0_CANGL
MAWDKEKYPVMTKREKNYGSERVSEGHFPLQMKMSLPLLQLEVHDNWVAEETPSDTFLFSKLENERELGSLGAEFLPFLLLTCDLIPGANKNLF